MIDHVITFGEGLAILRGGELWQARTIEVGTGGAEANVAMTLARSGVPVTWFGRVGDDGLGRRVARELRAEGVAVRTVVDPVNPTGLLIKELLPGGRTSVVNYRRGSAGSRLNAADVALLPISGSSLVHLTGITCGLSRSAREAVEVALTAAADQGATVSFDVNHRRGLWSDDEAAPVYRAVAARAGILFASVDEVPLLLSTWAGDDPGQAVDALLEHGFGHVVVTAGGRGAVAGIDGVRYSVEAVPVAVVDTVGAGDAFVGGYLAGLVAGHPPPLRLRVAAELGAAACRHPGDWEGAADRGGLDADGGDPVRR